MDYEDLLRAARKAAVSGAKTAEEVLSSGEGSKPLGRGASGDVTLYVDKAVEDAIFDSIGEEFDAFSFLGEERGLVRVGSDYPLFIVDLVDGSFNASRLIPPYAVSIAVSTGPKLRDVAVGVVHMINPKGVVFHAVAEGGAYRGVERLVVPREERGDIGVVIAYSRKTHQQVGAFASLAAERGWKIRTLGCASYEVCLVSEGRYDVYANLWGSARVVDLAAALLIAQESGCSLFLEPENPLLDLKERIRVAVARTDDILRKTLELDRARSVG